MQPMFTREAADSEISRQKSAEQTIWNLLEVRAPEKNFIGKCLVVCGRESKHRQSSHARTVTSSSKEKPTVFKNNVTE
jgi:hypothetical protein